MKVIFSFQKDFFSIWVGILIAGMTCTACTALPKRDVSSDSEGYANRIIAEKVDVAATAQREFAAAVQEDKEMAVRKQAALETDEVDVDYIGKPQQLLETLAYRYGYKYIETGKRIELKTINIRVKKTAPLEVVRNIGHQIGQPAEVVLDKSTKTLRLIYKKV